MNGVPIREVNGSFPDVTVPVNKVPIQDRADLGVRVRGQRADQWRGRCARRAGDAPLCGWEVQLSRPAAPMAPPVAACPPTRSAIRWAPSTNPDGSPQYNTDGSLKVSNPQRAANQLGPTATASSASRTCRPPSTRSSRIAPMDMPSVSRCNPADANGNPTTTPIWGSLTAAQIANLRPARWCGNVAGEIAPSVHGQDQSKWHPDHHHRRHLGRRCGVKSGEPAFFKRNSGLQGTTCGTASCAASAIRPR